MRYRVDIHVSNRYGYGIIWQATCKDLRNVVGKIRSILYFWIMFLDHILNGWKLVKLSVFCSKYFLFGLNLLFFGFKVFWEGSSVSTASWVIFSRRYNVKMHMLIFYTVLLEILSVCIVKISSISLIIHKPTHEHSNINPRYHKNRKWRLIHGEHCSLKAVH